MKTLTLKIPEDVHRQLTSIAAERGATKSLLVREALTAYMADPGTPRESFPDAAGALVGSVPAWCAGPNATPRPPC